MTGAVFSLQRVLEGGIVRLFVCAGAGALAFTATIMLVWACLGCPDGPEKTIWHYAWRRWSRPKQGTFSGDIETGEGLLHRPAKAEK
jgi:hypothetical protein